MLKIGKLYIWHETDGGYKTPDKKKLVLLLSAEKVKPIYTKYKFLVMETNETRQEILDKFKLEKFEKDFTEVNEEKDLSRLSATKKEKQ